MITPNLNNLGQFYLRIPINLETKTVPVSVNLLLRKKPISKEVHQLFFGSFNADYLYKEIVHTIFAEKDG